MDLAGPPKYDEQVRHEAVGRVHLGNVVARNFPIQATTWSERELLKGLLATHEQAADTTTSFGKQVGMQPSRLC